MDTPDPDRGGGNFFGRLGNRLQSSVKNVTALIQDPVVRQKAGELIQKTANSVGRHSQVLAAQVRTSLVGSPGGMNDAMRRARRKQQQRRLENNRQQQEQDCDLQVGRHLYEHAPLCMRSQLWTSLLVQPGPGGKNSTPRTGPGGEQRMGGSGNPSISFYDAEYYFSLTKGVKSLGEYRALYESGHDTSVTEGVCNEAIVKDCHRTFPDNAYFSTQAGQDKLYRVLVAYSAHDEEVGYCQGMNFLTGLLLLHVEEETAFALLVHVMSVVGMRGIYLPDMKLLQLRLRQLDALIFAYCPRLHEHFESTGIQLVIFASPWFLSLFTSEFSLNFSGRVMDVMLADRSDVILIKTALALLMEAEEKLLELEGFETTIMFLKSEIHEWSRERLNLVISEAVALTSITEESLAAMAAQFDAEDQQEAERRRPSSAAVEPGTPTSPQDLKAMISYMDLLGLDIEDLGPEDEAARSRGATAASGREGEGGAGQHQSFGELKNNLANTEANLIVLDDQNDMFYSGDEGDWLGSDLASSTSSIDTARDPMLDLASLYAPAQADSARAAGAGAGGPGPAKAFVMPPPPPPPSRRTSSAPAPPLDLLSGQAPLVPLDDLLGLDAPPGGVGQAAGEQAAPSPPTAALLQPPRNSSPKTMPMPAPPPADLRSVSSEESSVSSSDDADGDRSGVHSRGDADRAGGLAEAALSSPPASSLLAPPTHAEPSIEGSVAATFFSPLLPTSTASTSPPFPQRSMSSPAAGGSTPSDLHSVLRSTPPAPQHPSTSTLPATKSQPVQPPAENTTATDFFSFGNLSKLADNLTVRSPSTESINKK